MLYIFPGRANSSKNATEVELSNIEELAKRTVLTWIFVTTGILTLTVLYLNVYMYV